MPKPNLNSKQLPQITLQTFSEVLHKAKLDKNNKAQIIEDFKREQPEVYEQLSRHTDLETNHYKDHWILAMSIIHKCLEVELGHREAIVLAILGKPK